MIKALTPHILNRQFKIFEVFNYYKRQKDYKGFLNLLKYCFQLACKGLTYAYFYGIIYIGNNKVLGFIFPKTKIKNFMYNPYYPFQSREVSVQVEKVVPRKKAAIELFRALSGFMAAFLIVLISAFALRFAEIQISKSFVNNAIAAPAIEKTIDDDREKCSVKEILEKGYLKVTGIFSKDNFNKLLGIKTAHAAVPYESMRLIQSAETLNLASGEKELFIVGFKNTGTKTWTRDGTRFVSVYTYSPKYRKSVFEDVDWYDSIQPAKLKNETVNPGEIGYIEFFLTAPSEPGEYIENFKLAAENTAWMTGGEFSIKINVTEKATLEATKLIQSHREMTLKKGEVQEFRIGFKNTGITEWKERSIVRADLQVAAADNTMMFMDSSWVDTIRPVVVNDSVISSGQLGFLTFKLKAPQNSGNYTLHFSLAANGEYVDGGDFSIPITVTDESVGVAPSSNPVPVISLGPEPNVRVGLFYYNAVEHEPVRVVANSDYEVRNANGGLLTNLPPRVQATLNFDFNTNLYTIEVSGSTYTSAEHLRLIPIVPGTFQITSFENRPSWNRTLNDNVFRGTMEYRYSEEAGRLWVINDLPMEDYIKGLAESMSTDPLEYQKALAIAARTYAYYHYANGGKHPKQNLTLNASEGDQVYRGYNSELRLPTLVQAVNETRGQVVTYAGQVVVTPYFSKSNGYTRTWTQAWGGESRPWLPSVLCPYDKANGRTLYGHGVGMSMWDARDRAKDGQGYLTILSSYYIGTQTAQTYQ